MLLVEVGGIEPPSRTLFSLLHTAIYARMAFRLTPTFLGVVGSVCIVYLFLTIVKIRAC